MSHTHSHNTVDCQSQNWKTLESKNRELHIVENETFLWHFVSNRVNQLILSSVCLFIFFFTSTFAFFFSVRIAYCRLASFSIQKIYNDDVDDDDWITKNFMLCLISKNLLEENRKLCDLFIFYFICMFRCTSLTFFFLLLSRSHLSLFHSFCVSVFTVFQRKSFFLLLLLFTTWAQYWNYLALKLD